MVVGLDGFSARLSRLREQKGLTMKELAGDDLSAQTIYSLEHGKQSDIRLSTLQTLAERLDCSIGYLVGESPESDGDALEKACANLLHELCREIGDNPGRPGLVDTPRRMAGAYREILTKQDYTATTFENADRVDQIILVKGIRFVTFCEHHVLPIIGTASVGYIPDPDAEILGLSKLARIVHHYAAGLQVQERLTEQVADQIMEDAHPQGCMVVLSARHDCMAIRGVKQPEHETVTSAVRGRFRCGADDSNDSPKAEMMRMVVGDGRG
jgi:GTP cyclohydrolase I